jgi:hypothetical protein
MWVLSGISTFDCLNKRLNYAPMLCMSIFVLSSVQAHGQPFDASCGEVISAIQRLRAQPWVLMRATVTKGTHPEFYTSMASILLDRRSQILVLDGERFSSRIEGSDKEALDRVTGAKELHPDSPCLRVEMDKEATSPFVEYSYSVKSIRADAHLRVSISTSSGLPVKVQIDGPQLFYRRSLSRPGKPPQVMLWPNGFRYYEIREYVFGEKLVNSSHYYKP